MAENRVIARWHAGMPAIAAWMTTHSLLVAQAMAASGADAVIVDMQHGSATLDDVLALSASIEVRGAEPFVRIASVDAGLIGRLLDSGVTGLIAPLIESAAQAREFVEAMHYPSEGRRSYGPRIPAFRYGPGYAGQSNRSVVSLAMIETTAGISALDAVLCVDGLSGIFVGPSDLSMSLGFPPPQPQQPVAVQEAIARIRSTVERSDRKIGIFCPNQQTADQALGAGFHLITTPPDLVLVETGTKSAIDKLR